MNRTENLTLEIENMKIQAGMDRWPASKSIQELVRFVEENQPGDCLLNNLEKKSNPWIEKERSLVLAIEECFNIALTKVISPQ